MELEDDCINDLMFLFCSDLKNKFFKVNNNICVELQNGSKININVKEIT